MDKLKVFEAAYQTALADIGHLRKDPLVGELVEWLLVTDANPYSFLSEPWAGMTETAEGFVTLAKQLRSAAKGDVDVTFVAVGGEPRIVLLNRHDSSFVKAALGRLPPFARAEIIDLDVQPNEFGRLYDTYHVACLRRNFAMDAAANGVDFARKVASKYRLWSRDLEDGLDDSITRHAVFLRRRTTKNNRTTSELTQGPRQE